MRGRAIRALRLRNGWTQVELAAHLGTDAVTVSRWERGVSLPRPSAQIRLRELSEQPGSDIRSLVRVIGDADAGRLLRRALLLSHRPKPRRFIADPALRLREVERAYRQQAQLKAGARLTT